MNKGPNQPQNPGNRGRRRHRRGKGQHNQPGGGQQGMRGPGGSGGPGGGGGQNRGRRRYGAPQFVGPMDHSYRNNQGNGNELYPQNGRYRGAGRGGPQQHVNGSAGEQTVASDGPTRVVCFIDDLFFLAKIQETARKLGVKVEFVKAEKEIIDRLTSDEEHKPSLIIFDLNNANAKPLTLIPKLKSKLKKQTSIVGFLSHLQGDLKVKAQEAGCDMVVPRSAFSQNLPALLRRHGSDLQGTEA